MVGKIAEPFDILCARVFQRKWSLTNPHFLSPPDSLLCGGIATNGFEELFQQGSFHAVMNN